MATRKPVTPARDNWGVIVDETLEQEKDDALKYKLPTEAKEKEDDMDDIIEDTTTRLEKLSFDTPDKYKSTCSSSSITETLREVTRSLKLLESRAESTLSKVSFPTKLDNETQDISEAEIIALKKFLVQKRLAYLNNASKKELEGLKGIGKKRATYILELRKEIPEPFKSIDDLRELGLSQE